MRINVRLTLSKKRPWTVILILFYRIGGVAFTNLQPLP